MANPYFAFKKFTVYHNRCAMKVGTDGVLLGAWVDLTGVVSMLDAGTGTGLIALMCAQRAPGVIIDAVEIDRDACDQARQNIAASPWEDSIRVHHNTFQEMAANATKRYDMIVSNPPYYRNSLKPPVASRSIARHDDRLSHESLLHYADSLLTDNGRLAVILPATIFEGFAIAAGFHNLHVLRQTFIRPAPGRDLSRCMAEFSRKQQQAGTRNELVIKEADNKSYSADYIALTQAFYLKF